MPSLLFFFHLPFITRPSCQPPARLYALVSLVRVMTKPDGSTVIVNGYPCRMVEGSLILHNATGWDQIEGLDHVEGLIQLRFSRCTLPDVEPLVGMASVSRLEGLTFDRSVVDSYDALARMECIGSLEGIAFMGSNLKTIPDLPVNRSLVRFSAAGSPLESLEGIDRFPSLETLNVDFTAIASFEGLEGCPNVKRVSARCCRSLGSLRGLQNARKLKELDISTSHIYWGGENRTPGRLASLRGLEHCESLVELDASGNAIASMKGIEHCTRLETLKLARNRITRIEGLERLSSLGALNLSGNPLESLAGIEPVAGTLGYLHVSDTKVDSLEPLRRFPHLHGFSARNTRVTSLEPLRGPDYNPMRPHSLLYKVDVSGSPVRSLLGLEAMTYYVPDIKARGCQLTSLDGLPNRKDFGEVDFDENDIPQQEFDEFFKTKEFHP